MKSFGFKEERLKAFWTFLTERQNIYWKREECAPPPWTKDPILRDHFFCNVYRELDRGTIFCRNSILDFGWGYDHELIFRVMLYRMFNQPLTYNFLDKLVSASYSRVYFDGKKAGVLLERKRDAGISVFRGAWMTSGASLDGGSKAKAYCKDMEKFAHIVPQFTRELLQTKKIEDAWNLVCTVKWFGGFSAYQVVLDLSYIKLFNTQWEDLETWMYPGPGAKLGLMWLLGHSPIKRSGKEVRKVLTEQDCQDMILHLKNNQAKYFKKYDLKFRKWEGKPLDLNNCEFALCEFNKYMRAHHGGKKKRFTPVSE
jgi:hypothetical protein